MRSSERLPHSGSAYRPAGWLGWVRHHFDSIHDLGFRERDLSLGWSLASLGKEEGREARVWGGWESRISPDFTCLPYDVGCSINLFAALHGVLLLCEVQRGGWGFFVECFGLAGGASWGLDLHGGVNG